MARPYGHPRHRRVREAAPARYTAEKEAGEGLAGVLLDSDVVIAILRGRSRAAGTIAELESSGVRTYVCAVTWGEVYAGIRPREEEVTEEFFQARGEVVLDSVTGRRAGSYLARYARSHALEIPDALVAAAATTSGLALWTLNRKHYPMPEIRFFEP